MSLTTLSRLRSNTARARREPTPVTVDLLGLVDVDVLSNTCERKRAYRLRKNKGRDNRGFSTRLVGWMKKELHHKNKHVEEREAEVKEMERKRGDGKRRLEDGKGSTNRVIERMESSCEGKARRKCFWLSWLSKPKSITRWLFRGGMLINRVPLPVR